MSRAETLIEVSDLSHTYLRGSPLQVPSLHGIHLEVRAGETVGLIGSTGSGKSTLLQHLNGLLRPQAGEVRVLGPALADPRVDIRAVRQRVGLVFQNPEDQLFEAYAGDDVAFGPRCLGWTADVVRERVRWAMEAVGLAFDLKDRLTASLSHGQRRRLAIAGVLALEPAVLVLDEPTAGLDPAGAQGLLVTLKEWKAQGNRALVIASHSMEDIAALADRVYVLAAGAVVLHGTPREVFVQPDLLAAHGLSVPLPTAVIAELQHRGLPSAVPALTVAEAASQVEVWFRGRQ